MAASHFLSHFKLTEKTKPFKKQKECLKNQKVLFIFLYSFQWLKDESLDASVEKAPSLRRKGAEPVPSGVFPQALYLDTSLCLSIFFQLFDPKLSAHHHLSRGTKLRPLEDLEGTYNLKTLGRHFLLELGDCNPAILNQLAKIETILLAAAKKAKATIVDSRFHQFSPFGISGVVVIAESHLTIHTWPEHAYAAVDIFSCGEALEPGAACDFLVAALQSKNPSMMEIKRGPVLKKEGLPLKSSKAFARNLPCDRKVI